MPSQQCDEPSRNPTRKVSHNHCGVLQCCIDPASQILVPLHSNTPLSDERSIWFPVIDVEFTSVSCMIEQRLDEWPSCLVSLMFACNVSSIAAQNDVTHCWKSLCCQAPDTVETEDGVTLVDPCIRMFCTVHCCLVVSKDTTDLPCTHLWTPQCTPQVDCLFHACSIS